MATAAPQSRLLQSPGELRNIIYEYVLTESDGLISSTLASGVRFCAATNSKSTKTRESNQLRYVCRQLYLETSALGLRYNDLTFSCSEEEKLTSEGKLGPEDDLDTDDMSDVFDTFDAFYHDCAAVYLSTIRRVTILADHNTLPPSHITSLAHMLSQPLISFCQQYPHAKVIVRFDWLLGEAEPVDCMIAWSKALGRPNPFPGELVHVEFGSLADILGACSLRGVRAPANLRFSCSHGLDEWLVECNLGTLLDRGRMAGEEHDVEWDQWVAIARRVHEEGI